MNELTTVQIFIVWALPVLFAVTLHEVAHGWMACKLGDRTAERLGRLSLNPFRHIDPIGTVLMPALLFIAGGIIFGWAKPVPVRWENLKCPRRDMALVALAGPGANLVMLLGWVVLSKMAMTLAEEARFIAEPLIHMGGAGIIINSILMLVNLVPLPPLDGSRVISAILPGSLAALYSRMEPWGLIVLVLLLVSGLLGRILSPALTVTQELVRYVLGV